MGGLQMTSPGPKRDVEKTLEPKTASKEAKFGSGNIGFAAKAAANGILDQKHSKEPANVRELLQVLSRGRASPPPAEDDYTRYRHAVAGAPDETTVAYLTSEMLSEHQANEAVGYQRVFGQEFTACPRDLPFNKGPSTSCPGLVEGLKLQEFRLLPVNETLGGTAIVFKDFESSVTLPHFLGEFRGPREDLKAAFTQIAVNGAHLIHGRNQALRQLGSSDSNDKGHAVIFLFCQQRQDLNTYAHFATGENGKVDYHTYLLTRNYPTQSWQLFKQGRRHLRNLQDLAKTNSYALRDHLVKVWNKNHPIVVSTPTPPPPPPPPAARDLAAAPGTRIFFPLNLSLLGAHANANQAQASGGSAQRPPRGCLAGAPSRGGRACWAAAEVYRHR
ncbi:hypothetical protein B0T14DRAFT_57046 [Immersiella caudata]|uniref:Uncharacterized protein n=1 Tax=Immersiella caudata TaxID=314043 RepID=A0AA39XGD9_9PEZI|nr:hypothetical protein B0T14DRAFT_57046 [Immersiella caudata]